MWYLTLILAPGEVIHRGGGDERLFHVRRHKSDDILAGAHRVADRKASVHGDKLGAVFIIREAHLKNEFQRVADADRIGIVPARELLKVHMDSEHAVLIGFENHVLSAVEVRGLARRARESRALAVGVVAVFREDGVAVDAAAEGHICIRERRSVRLQEGDLSRSRKTQGKRVQRVELALCPSPSPLFSEIFENVPR